MCLCSGRSWLGWRTLGISGVAVAGAKCSLFPLRHPVCELQPHICALCLCHRKRGGSAHAPAVRAKHLRGERACIVSARLLRKGKERKGHRGSNLKANLEALSHSICLRTCTCWRAP
eukprot:1158198-Pelagomonas_calceolata.AAC.9